MSDYALEITNLHKSFKLPVDKANKLKTAILNRAKGIRGRYVDQKVLRGINLKVKRGEFFGIVGRNGSGKSTLLKIISQIYQPTKGTVKVGGKLVPFIELGVGFNPELSGRENVYLNGALLGFSNREITDMYAEIVGFAELEDFMEQKLKNYSSGMQVRLAFSLAIRSKADILVLDEVLAVGDEAFQRKCNEYFQQIKSDAAKTIILVTHSMEAVRQYCDRAMMIEDGKIVIEGSPEDVANKYTEANFRTSKKEEPPEEADGHPLGLSDRVPYFKVKPVSEKILTYKDDLVFDIENEITDDTPVMVAFSIVDESRGGAIFANRAKPTTSRGRHRLRYVFPLELYNDTNLLVTAVLDTAEDFERLAFTSEANICRFAIRNDRSFYGLLRPYGKAHGHWEGWGEALYDTRKKKIK